MRLAGLLAHGAEHGMAFDSYLMDAYWFEEHIPAPDFKKAAWPDGRAGFWSGCMKWRFVRPLVRCRPCRKQAERQLPQA